MYGPAAVLTDSIYSFSQDVIRNSSDYELQQTADSSFCAQICFRVDRSIQIYLQEASRQTDITGRPCPSLMSFTIVKHGIKMSDYQRIVLPASICQLLSERINIDTSDRKRSSEPAGNSNPSLVPIAPAGNAASSPKQKARNVQQVNKNDLANDHCDASWQKCFRQHYNKILQSADQIKAAINLPEGTDFCCKYHIGGRCKSACSRSHESLSDSQRAALGTFLKRFRTVSFPTSP